MKNWILFALAIIIGGTPAYGATARVVVPAASLRSSNVTITDAGRKKRKLVYCLERSTRGCQICNWRYAIHLLLLYYRFSKSKESSGGKLTTYTLLKKAGTSLCKKIYVAPTPTPIPQPPASGNFDNIGNVTVAGKVAFGIPSNLTANISQGRTIHTGYCSGCHQERTGKTFPQLRSSIAQSPMLYDSSQVTDEMLANITAFLNRFNF